MEPHRRHDVQEKRGRAGGRQWATLCCWGIRWHNIPKNNRDFRPGMGNGKRPMKCQGQARAGFFTSRVAARSWEGVACCFSEEDICQNFCFLVQCGLIGGVVFGNLIFMIIRRL